MIKKTIITLLFLSTFSLGQTSHAYFFGYHGSWTFLPLGTSAGSVAEDNFGFYFTINLGLQSPSEKEYMDNISYDEAKYTFEDAEGETVWNYYNISAGITYPIIDKLFVYSSLSFTEGVQYVYFSDPFYILGDNGNYAVKGRDENKIFIGAKAGIIFIPEGIVNSGIFISGGISVNPKAFELGIGYKFATIQ